MSSFIGHSLAAATVYVAARPRNWLWCAWLIVVASAPDVDYLIPALRLSGPLIIRITHSFVGCQVVPVMTWLILWLAGVRGRKLAVWCLQVSAAGLSHVVLDLLVGVTPAALLWPFSRQTYRLPFGVLPSAGRLHWANGLLLRNLLIEVGVLGSVFLMVWMRKSKKWPVLVALFAITCVCMFIAYGLKR